MMETSPFFMEIWSVSLQNLRTNPPDDRLFSKRHLGKSQRFSFWHSTKASSAPGQFLGQENLAASDFYAWFLGGLADPFS